MINPEIKIKLSKKLRNQPDRLVLLTALVMLILTLCQSAMAESKLTIAILPVEYVGISDVDGEFIEKGVFQSFNESGAFIVKSRSEYHRVLNEVMRENEHVMDADECYVLAAESIGVRRIVQVDMKQDKGTVYISAQVVNLKKEVLATYVGMCSAEPLHENVRVEIDEMVDYFLKEFTGNVEPNGLRVGTLEILTEPAGAKVFLDSFERGVTPSRFDWVKATDHALTLTLDSYLSYTGTVRIKSGKSTEVEHIFQKQTGTLHVVSEPTGATVYLDGGNLGETELKHKKIPVGTGT